MASNWREIVADLLREVHWSLGEWGEKFTGYLALQQDAVTQGAQEAVYCPWLLEETSPDDALPIVGRERNMPRYPAEEAASHRTRLHGAWDAWDFAGHESAFFGAGSRSQFTALGLTGTVYTEAQWERGPLWEGQLWKSQFWILLDADQGFGAPLECGGGELASDGYACGITYDETLGPTPEVISAIRYIVKKWKAGDEICREVIASSGEICGDGSLAADGSLCGGFASTIYTL